MIAGLNLLATFYTYSYNPDDAIGGSQPTGTIVYEQIPVRVEQIEATMALVEQGLETPSFYSALVFYGAVSLKENDTMEIVAPVESWYYGKRFRIIRVQHPSMNYNGGNQFVRLVLRRYDEAHGEGFIP